MRSQRPVESARRRGGAVLGPARGRVRRIRWARTRLRRRCRPPSPVRPIVRRPPAAASRRRSTTTSRSRKTASRRSTSCARPRRGRRFPSATPPSRAPRPTRSHRTGTCGFVVSVTAVPQISVTKIVAYGDSLTEGVTSPDPTTLLLNLPDSYPMKLQAMMSARYTDQAVEVFNEGCSGEFADELVAQLRRRRRAAAGRARPRQAAGPAADARRQRPQQQHAAISGVIGALEQMIDEAQRRGIAVIVASLPPQNPEGSRGDGADDLPEFSRECEGHGRRRGRHLPRPLQPDGHVTSATSASTACTRRRRGISASPKLWLEEIQRNFEVTGGPQPAGFTA